MRIGNWELSIDQIGSDLTNAQFPILNSHPNKKLTQIRPLSEQIGFSPRPAHRETMMSMM